MGRRKIFGIVLLVLFAMAIVGSIANGSLANIADENIYYMIGFFGGLGALLVFGLINVFRD